MKALLVLVLTLTAQFAMARLGGELFFVTGSDAGKRVTSASYVGYEQICFKGDANQAAWKLYFLMTNDIEKAKPFARAAANKKSITYSYVETKCTDEGESEASCRSEHKALACKK